MFFYRSISIWLLRVGLAIALVTHVSSAGADQSDKTNETPKRQKAIDFEDEVVEGMNKRPLDSVSQISERDRTKRKPHLYRKRAGFRDETVQTLTELRAVSL